MKTFRTNYMAPAQISDVILSNEAVQCVWRWSLLIRQLSVRWFGCSQCLPFMFNFGCHDVEMDGRCEAQSTTFNSFINQASVRGMNYWLSEFRGNSLFLFSPWWTCFAAVRSVPDRCSIMGCLFLARKWGWNDRHVNGRERGYRHICSGHYPAC